jgi:hypothetical protein
MSRQPMSMVTTIGIDIGKSTFHLVGLDQRGSIVLQLKTSREQLARRLANLPRCLIGMDPALALTTSADSSQPSVMTFGWSPRSM